MTTLEVEFPIRRMQIQVPRALMRDLHSGERYLTQRYRDLICMNTILTMSYRKGCVSFNLHQKRIGSEALPFSTFVNDVINEGTALIEAKRNKAAAILDEYGFNWETGRYTEEVLPDSLMNICPDVAVVDPDRILAGIIPTWNSDAPELEDVPEEVFVKESNDLIEEGETSQEERIYSEPDTTEIKCNRKPRRKNRIAEPKDKIPSICENYVAWRNQQEEMHELCRILHVWELETDTQQIVYVMIDAVYVKQQAEKHIMDSAKKQKRTLKDEENQRVTHWNIKIEWDESKSYVINDEDLDIALKQLLAFLLTNGLISRYMVFFTDGESKIFIAIDTYFSYWKRSVYLDFPHVQKKCYDLLSKAIISRRVVDPRGEKEFYVKGPKAGQVKKQEMTSLSVLYTRRVTSILWAGNTDEAVNYLKNIDPEYIYNEASLDKLIGYLNPENKGKYITCYALRRKCGLRNSSNGVECANNQIVAHDQKEGSKTYRAKGSYASAALKTLEINHEWNRWFFEEDFTFRYS